MSKRVWGCGNKVRYKDDQQAKAALSRVGMHSGKVPVRWYWCPDCQGTHLTSQEG